MLPNIVKGANKKGVSWLYLIMYIIIIIIVVVVIVKVYKAIKSGADSIGEKIGDKIIANQTGVDENRVGFIRAKAASLWDDSTTWTWLPQNLQYYTSDDYVSTINSLVSTQEAVLLARYYKEHSGDSLKGAIATFWGTDINRINQNYLTAIRSV